MVQTDDVGDCSVRPIVLLLHTLLSNLILRHAVGEEIVVYPLMETHLGPAGKELADKDREDHIVVKKQLTQLDSLIAEGKVGTAAFDGLMKACHDHLKEHNDNEERDDLPMLEPKIGNEGSLSAAKRFTLTKKFVPTRYVGFELCVSSRLTGCQGLTRMHRISLLSRRSLVSCSHQSTC